MISTSVNYNYINVLLIDSRVQDSCRHEFHLYINSQGNKKFTQNTKKYKI